MKRRLTIILTSTLVMSMPALGVDTDAVVGGAIGGGVGAAIGSEIGGREGAIIGGAVGGAAGAAIATDGKNDQPKDKVVYVEKRETDKEVIYVKDHHHVPPGHMYRRVPPGHAKHKHKHKHKHY